MRKTLLALAVLLIAIPATSRAQTTIVAFGDCGWRYAHVEAPFDPVAFSRVSFDDAAWTQGCAPLKRAPACIVGGTVMPTEGHIIMRRHIFNTMGTPVAVQVDMRHNYIGGLSINGLPENTCGTPIGACDGSGGQCSIGQSFMAVPGDNVVMIRTFFAPGYGDVLDARITALNPTAIRRGTWGEVKAIYR